MRKYISCGNCNRNYLYIFLAYFIIGILLIITLAFISNNLSQNNNSDFIPNPILFVFLSFFGQSLFIFVELILNKINFGNKKEGNVPERNSKKESSLVIQYIFNDLSVDIITCRDTINIIIISLLLLLVD